MKSILAVDDSAANNKILKYYLEKDGYRVFTSQDVRGAYQILEQNNIDLIITDYRMPDENGIDFLISLKKDKQTSSIPVLILSSEDSEELRLKAFQLGLSDWMTKPFIARLVSRKIQKFIP